MPEKYPGLHFVKDHRLSFADLDWWQGQMHRYPGGHAWRLSRLERPGLVVPRWPSGAPTPAWLPIHAGSGSLTLQEPLGSTVTEYARLHPDAQDESTLYLVNQEGAVIEYPFKVSAEVVTLTDNATWYTLVCRSITTYDYEPGTITLDPASLSVVGVGTQFGRYAGKTDEGIPYGTFLRVDAADTSNGHEGTYEVDTVTDDTNLTLTSMPGGSASEGSLIFSVSGNFKGAPPAEPDLHRRYSVEFELVAQTRSPAAGDFLICDVRWDSGDATPVRIVDLRAYNTYRSRTRGRRYCVPEAPIYWDHHAGQAQLHQIDMGATAHASEASYISMCEGDQPGVILAFGRQDNGADVSTQVRELTALGNIVDDPGGAGTVNVVTGLTTATNDGQLAAIKVPEQIDGDYTHYAFVANNGTIELHGSTDDGASWSSVATIWNPLAVDALDVADQPAAIWLRNGRILVLASYYDDSASLRDIRWIFSDDHGATWDTNTNAGYVWLQDGGGVPTYNAFFPSIWQAESGQIVTACEYNDGSDKLVYVEASDSDQTLDRLGALPLALYGIPAGRYLDDERIHPAVWCDSFGNIVLFYTAHDATATDTYIAASVTRYTAEHGYEVIFDGPFMTIDLNTTTDDDVRLAVCESGGQLWLGFEDLGGSKELRVVPVRMVYRDYELTAVEEADPA